jgi:hypothetical protein
MAAIALVCFSVPAMAIDWNFYGNARMATFYDSRDYGDNLNAAGTDSKDTDTQWDFQGNSRIGANIKAENLKAQFEFGVNEASVSSRRLYGVWNFGAGTLKVGKDYSPTSQFISGQVFDGDLGLLGVGTSYSSRNGQVALGFGGFTIALITPQTPLAVGMASKTTKFAAAPPTTTVVGGATYITPSVTATSTATFKGDPDRIIPKIELGWGMAFDTWNFNLMGGYQYYSIEDVTSFTTLADTNDIGITSYVLGVDGGVNFGPAYVKTALSYGQNIGNAGWSIPSGVNGRPNTYQGGLAVWDGDDDVNDTNTFMGALVAGIKVSDMLSFEGGFGYRNDITDSGFQYDTETWAAYVQSVIALAPGVYVIPEVGYYDFDNDASNVDAGSEFYLGGKWQINF